MMLLPFALVLLLAILAGVLMRFRRLWRVAFWLFVGAAWITTLLGIGLAQAADAWWNGPPDCGSDCFPGAPPLSPGWERAEGPVDVTLQYVGADGAPIPDVSEETWPITVTPDGSCPAPPVTDTTIARGE